MRRYLPVVLAAVLLAACAVFVASSLAVTTDITHFLPAGEDAALAPLSRELADSELTRTVVVSVGGADRAQSIAGAQAVARALEQRDGVAWVQSGVGDAVEDAIYDLYFPRRWYFVASEPDALAQRLSDDGLATAAEGLKRALAGPRGPLIRRIATQDPLLLFPGVLDSLGAMRAGELSVENGQFVTPDGHAIVFFATQHSPFDSAAMRPFADAFQADLAAIERDHDVVVEQSGVYRFALASEQAIQSDVRRISIASTVAIVLLFLLVFRVFRYTLLGLVPMATGVLAGLAVSLAVFGELHGLTLAFGATLIGVVIDYPVHLFNHHTIRPASDGPEGTARRVWPGLLLGAATTMAGFGGLAFTAFPGVQEMAVFAATGVGVALLVTRFVLPPLMPVTVRPVRLQQWLANRLAEVAHAAAHRRLYLVVLPVAGLIVMAIGVPRANWVDDPSALNNLDPALRAEDEEVRARVSRMDMGRFIIALGDDDQDALRQNEVAYQLARQAREDGLLEAFTNVHALLWPAAAQRQSREAVAAADLETRLPAALVGAGFRAQAFDVQALGLVDEVDPLTPADLSESPLERLFAGFRVPVGEKVAYLTLLRGVDDMDALRERADAHDNIYVFDQSAFLSDTYAKVRSRTMQMILFGLIGVFAVLLFRYRRFRIALAAFVPSVLAAGTTLGIIGLSGTPTHMLHVVSLLLVLSIGVDYSVFLAESMRSDEGWDATLLSIVMACLSSIFAFGLLGLSDMPALRAIGTTVSLGVLLSLVFAPAALLMVSREFEG